MPQLRVQRKHLVSGTTTSRATCHSPEFQLRAIAPHFKVFPMSQRYEDDLKQLIGGQVRHAGLSQEGYPYLILAKDNESRFFYVIAQCDAEGNGPGFLQLSERQGRVA
jgi:hypothetical protein